MGIKLWVWRWRRSGQRMIRPAADTRERSLGRDLRQAHQVRIWHRGRVCVVSGYDRYARQVEERFKLAAELGENRAMRPARSAPASPCLCQNLKCIPVGDALSAKAKLDPVESMSSVRHPQCITNGSPCFMRGRARTTKGPLRRSSGDFCDSAAQD